MTEVFRYNYDSMALQLARDFVSMDSIGAQDYLFYPHHDYTYDLIIGNIDFENMSWTDATRYTITYVTQTSGVSGYRSIILNHAHDSDNLTNPYNVAVYGSGENMPHLIDRGGDFIETATLFSVIGAFICFMCIRILDNVSRR